MLSRGALPGIAAIWAGVTCVLGPLLASLAFAIYVNDPGDGWGISSQFPYLVFVGALLAGAAGFLPLTAVLWIYLALTRRWPALERNWYTVCVATFPVAVFCYVGVGPLTAPFLGESRLFWVPLDGFGALVIAASYLGLTVARALIPALSPGALLKPDIALARMLRRPTPKALLLGGWIFVVTAMTWFYSSEMILPCADPALDSCFENIRTRGWPYPFVQRNFQAPAFIYDLLTLTLLHSPLMIWMRMRVARTIAK